MAPTNSSTTTTTAVLPLSTSGQVKLHATIKVASNNTVTANYDNENNIINGLNHEERRKLTLFKEWIANQTTIRNPIYGKYSEKIKISE